MDGRIDFQRIRDSFGCDNCEHENDGMWDDYCRVCNLDSVPPSKYYPVKGSIQKQFYFKEFDRITFGDYLRFLKTGK